MRCDPATPRPSQPRSFPARLSWPPTMPAPTRLHPNPLVCPDRSNSHPSIDVSPHPRCHLPPNPLAPACAMSVHHAAHSLHEIARDKRLILTTSASSHTPQLIPTTSASSHTPQPPVTPRLILTTSASSYTPQLILITSASRSTRPQPQLRRTWLSSHALVLRSTARTFVLRSAASEVTETPTRAPAPCAALRACVASHTHCTTPED